MKNIKTIISLVLVMAMMSSVALAANITDPMLIIKGEYKAENSAEWVHYDDRYVDGDMFANFKNIMPGDEKTQTVYIQNAWNAYDYINLYMRAELHTDGEPNPMSGKVNEAQIGDTEAEKLAYMHDFLSHLTLEIKNEGRVLYRGNPDELAVGFENDKAQLQNTEKLGIIENGDIVKLDITLSMPNDLKDADGNDIDDNIYANRVGEVDWVFTYSGHNYPEDDPDPTSKPTTAPTSSSTDPTGSTGPTSPTEPTEPTIDIDDPSIPLNPVDPDNPSSPDTGDHSNMLPYIVMFIIGLMGLILTSKKRKTN